MVNSIRTVNFSCGCGKAFRARVDQGGKAYICPSCGVTVRVPQLGMATGAIPPISHGDSHAKVQADGTASANGKASESELTETRDNHSARFFSAPATFGHMLAHFMVTWTALSLLCFVISFTSIVMKYVALGLFLLTTAATIQQIWFLMRARQRVLDAKDVPLLWGFVRLIAWDPIEGVLFLRNKSIAFSDDNLQDAQGGVRFLYPIFGEELALRVPLEVQTLQFSDENVLTREYLSVTIRGTMKWRIADVRKFYLLVSRELRSTANHGDQVSQGALFRGPQAQSTTEQLLRAAIEWLRVLTEEQTRLVVSRAKSGLLIADRLTRELVPSHSGPENTGGSPGEGALTAELGNATDGLAGAIHDTLAHRLDMYGIAVEDVSLQEIRLPEVVMQECIEAAKAYYYPLLGKREGSRKVAELAAEANILGPDAVAAKQVVGAAPAFAMADFLSAFVQKRLAPQLGLTGDATGTAAALAALTAQDPQAKKSLPSDPPSAN